MSPFMVALVTSLICSSVMWFWVFPAVARHWCHRRGHRWALALHMTDAAAMSCERMAFGDDQALLIDWGEPTVTEVFCRDCGRTVTEEFT